MGGQGGLNERDDRVDWRDDSVWRGFPGLRG